MNNDWALSPCLREKQILLILPISRSTLWRWVKQGKFPQPKKLSDRITVWPSTAVHGWISANKG